MGEAIRAGMANSRQVYVMSSQEACEEAVIVSNGKLICELFWNNVLSNSRQRKISAKTKFSHKTIWLLLSISFLPFFLVFVFFLLFACRVFSFHDENDEI